MSATAPRPRVLVICSDKVGAEMAGPAIRSYEMARALQSHADVTLAGLPGEGDPPGVRTVRYELRDPRALRAPIDGADAVIAQPAWPHIARWLRASRARLIFDAYDPEPFEVLEFLADRPAALRGLVQTLTIDRFLDAFHMGHHISCASDKQRDLWLGAMMASGLVPPSSYDRDPSLLSVIDCVPFGVPSEPPQASGRAGPRQRFPAIGPEDEIVLWNGGLWSWLDAPTAIRAVHLLAGRRPGVRLVFMGAGSQGPARRATDDARRLAGELGALDRSVFFNDRWVPYAERGEWLLQANCSVSTHVEHLETRFAFRTRLLDCFWAGVPVVCTTGDELAGLVEHGGLGATVPASRPEAVAGALERVLQRGRGAYAPALAQAAADHHWEITTRPLVRWLTAPQLPPRIGAGQLRPVARVARSAGFTGALGIMRALGLRWPAL